jgi:hypothetical protein
MTYLHGLLAKLKASPAFLDQFLEIINTPLGLSSMELLKTLHIADPTAEDSMSQESAISAKPVLSIDFFLELENELYLVSSIPFTMSLPFPRNLVDKASNHRYRSKK